MKRKLTLGGKLTIVVAILWAGSMAMMFLGPNSEEFSTIQGICWCIAIALSFPLGLLSSTMTRMGGIPSVGEFMTYMLLMTANLFLLGYAAAGLWRLVVFLRRPATIPNFEPQQVSATTKKVVEQVVPPNGP